MNNRKLDGFVLQDLYHYSLAIQGNCNSAFPSGTLYRRLAAVDRVQDIVGGLDEEGYIALDGDNLGADSQRIESEGELLALGNRLRELVQREAKRLGVDPCTGEKPEPPCSNCGAAPAWNTVGLCRDCARLEPAQPVRPQHEYYPPSVD